MLLKYSRLLAITALLSVLMWVFIEQCAIAEEEPGPHQGALDMSIALGLVTHHVNPGDDTNEDSNFMALSLDKYSIARFINSYNDETWFGGINYHTSKLQIFKDEGLYLQGNLYAGIVYGYGDHLPNLGGFTPILLPTAGVGYKRACLELMYFPTQKGGVFSVALRIDLSLPKTSGNNDQQTESPAVPQPNP